MNNIDVRLEAENRTTDEGLAERIANVPKWNVSIPNHNLKADVKHGIVTPRRRSEWQCHRASILKNIEHVSGVVGITDRITLKPRALESDIQRKVKDALERHAGFEANNIKVTASGGTATLSGKVEIDVGNGPY